jgi:hypothetical protein
MGTKKAAAVKKPSIRKTTPATAEKGEKAPRTRKPPVERAVKLAALATKKIVALARTTGKWRGEATEEQQTACERLTGNLTHVQGFVTQILADVNLLHTTGFTPTAGARGRKAVAVGTQVKLKEGKFDEVAHGADNLFEVVQVTDKYTILRGVDNPRVQFPAPRNWFDIVSAPAATPDEDDAA